MAHQGLASGLRTTRPRVCSGCTRCIARHQSLGCTGLVKGRRHTDACGRNACMTRTPSASPHVAPFAVPRANTNGSRAASQPRLHVPQHLDDANRTEQRAPEQEHFVPPPKTNDLHRKHRECECGDASPHGHAYGLLAVVGTSEGQRILHARVNFSEVVRHRSFANVSQLARGVKWVDSGRPCQEFKTARRVICAHRAECSCAPVREAIGNARTNTVPKHLDPGAGRALWPGDVRT